MADATVTVGARSRVSFARPRLNMSSSWLGGLLGVVAILVIWTLVSAVFFAKSQSIPYPWRVVTTLLDDFSSSAYWTSVFDTVGSAAQGFLWGNLIAFAMAIVALLLPLLEGLITQLAVVTACIPLTALGPVITIISAPGSRAPSIILAAMTVILTSVIGIIVGLRAASPVQLEVVTAAGGSRLDQLRRVRLIAAIPAIVAACKIAVPASFLGAVLGEYYLLGVDSGLGIQILSAQSNNNPLDLWALAITCGAVAGLGYWIISLIGRLASPWSEGSRS
ncbi:ABC transporter permease [Gordonia sp. DT219]|uniref:ABC transporter permease n=1 Tax=Gordonia sp. DT219 TaxID=3416658 RepID=UPI003CF4A806